MRVKLLIGESDQNLSCFFSNADKTADFQLVGIAHDGKTLKQMGIEKAPDIILSEVFLPQIGFFEVVKSFRRLRMNCQFVAVADCADFATACEGIRSGISELLVQPLEGPALLNSLREVSARKSEEMFFLQDSISAMRAYYVGNFDALVKDHLSIRQTNAIYGTNYEEGAFQCVFVKLDSPNGLDPILDNRSSIESMKRVILDQLLSFCYDILFEPKFDGLLIIMNYAANKEEEVQHRFTLMQPALQNLFSPFYGIQVTICKGGVVHSISDLKNSREQAFEALWTRMVLGTQKVIQWQEPRGEIPETYKAALRKISERLDKAFLRLDTIEAAEAIHVLFSIPQEVLLRPELRDFVKALPDRFFSLNDDLLALLSDGSSRTEIRNSLKLSMTLREYEQSCVQLLTELIRKLESGENRQRLLIRNTTEYVEKNYMHPITIPEISNAVRLSPAYFSTLFKKMTGRAFVDFLTEYRINTAKELLRNTQETVSEIAESVGYQDAHYFSRVFKKVSGMHPTDYRKKHLG